MSDDPHFAPVLALLAAAPQPVYRTKIPAGTDPPYIRPYLHVEYPESESLDARSDRAIAWLYIHCVGANDQAASTVGVAVRAALMDVTPVVAGRTCWPIRFDHGQPPQPDETTGTLVIDQVDVYRLESVPT